jgi:hypothetical protein
MVNENDTITVSLNTREAKYVVECLELRRQVYSVTTDIPVHLRIVNSLLGIDVAGKIIGAIDEEHPNAKREATQANDMAHDHGQSKVPDRESSTTARESSKEGPGGFIRLAPEQEK